MNVFTRGIKNAFRNGIRTFSVVIILGLSIGLALSMMIARSAVEQKITSVKGSIGNTISVNPAGAQGFEGGGEPLTTSQVSSLESLANVSNVTATLSDRLTSDTTDLESAVAAGSLGERFSGTGSAAAQPPADSESGTTTTTRPSPPLRVTGTNDVSSATVFGGSTVNFTSGEAFDPTTSENVAVLGKSIAEQNSLSVGSTFTAYGETISVVGIYDTGTEFSNNGVIMPLATLQRLSDQADSVTAVTVTVNSIDNVDSTVTAIKSTLGDAADVTSNQESAANAVAPLENVKTIAMYSLVAALVAGAVIILLTMVMIVRERRREIGVMKAIGSSNSKTMLQFMVESATLTLIGLVVGLGIAVAVSAPITNALVDTSTSSSQNNQQPGQGGGMGRGGMGGALRGVAGAGLQTVETSIGWQTLAGGVGAALLIAIVGSAVPAYFISRIRPSEVMRAE